MSSITTPYAGFWMRLTAMLIDAVILTAIRLVLFGILYLMYYGILHVLEIRVGFNHYIAFTAGAILLNLWLTWLYYCLFESSSTQGTLGKMALGIRVTDMQGERITFEHASLRYFLKILSIWTALVGYLMTAFSSKKQSLHDILAQTVLSYKR